MKKQAFSLLATLILLALVAAGGYLAYRVVINPQAEDFEAVSTNVNTSPTPTASPTPSTSATPRPEDDQSIAVLVPTTPGSTDRVVSGDLPQSGPEAIGYVFAAGILVLFVLGYAIRSNIKEQIENIDIR